MNPKNERELWLIRFQNILQLEQESFEFYLKLLEEKGELLQEYGFKPIVKQILRDEGRHIRIAQELVQLVRGKGEFSEGFRACKKDLLRQDRCAR